MNKKIILVLSFSLILLLCSSLLIAENGNSNREINQEQNSETNSDEENQNQEMNAEENSENPNLISQNKNNVENVKIEKRENNRVRIKEGNFSVDCDCNLSEEREENRTKLKIKLSNGKDSEIKIMPEAASENAIQKLMIKNCNSENNCTIALKEVGKNETAKAVYEMQIEKQARILGMFKTKIQAKAQVNVETGEVKMIKPWWAKLVDEKE